MRWLIAGLLLTSHALAARYAVVVGNNHALPGSGYDRLEYADDDALRFAAFLEALGVQVAPDARPKKARVHVFAARSG